jgi:hypothetical protein
MTMGFGKRGLMILAGLGLSALLAFGAGAAMVPVSTVVVDFDESLVLRLNGLGRVVSAKGYNADNSVILNEPLFGAMRGKTPGSGGYAIHNILLDRRLYENKKTILITTTVAPSRVQMFNRSLQNMAKEISTHCDIALDVRVRSSLPAAPDGVVAADTLQNKLHAVDYTPAAS